jgi:hypothetical protein
LVVGLLAFKAPGPNGEQSTKNKALRTKHQVLNPQLLSQPQLQTVHLAAVCFVVVAGEVKQAVKNELRDFGVKRQTVFSRLRRGGFD